MRSDTRKRHVNYRNNGEVWSQNDCCEASLETHQSQNGENQKALTCFTRRWNRQTNNVNDYIVKKYTFRGEFGYELVIIEMKWKVKAKCVFITLCVGAQSLQSCLTLWPYGLQPTRLLCPWDSPGKNTGEGCHALLQGIFLNWGLNPRLLLCRWILYHWATRDAPSITPWKTKRKGNHSM